MTAATPYRRKFWKNRKNERALIALGRSIPSLDPKDATAARSLAAVWSRRHGELTQPQWRMVHALVRKTRQPPGSAVERGRPK